MSVGTCGVMWKGSATRMLHMTALCPGRKLCICLPPLSWSPHRDRVGIMAKDSHPVLCEHCLLGNAHCTRCEHCHLPDEKGDTKLFAQLGAELAVAVIVPCFGMGLPGGIQLEPSVGVGSPWRQPHPSKNFIFS